MMDAECTGLFFLFCSRIIAGEGREAGKWGIGRIFFVFKVDRPDYTFV